MAMSFDTSVVCPILIGRTESLASFERVFAQVQSGQGHTLLVSLTHFLLGQTEQYPLVLSIEDLHWSDDASLEFLLYLVRHLRSRPLLLLLTYRGEEVQTALANFLAALDRERAAMECSLTT